VRLHSPFGLLPTHPIPPIDAINNKHRTALQNRNRFAFLIDAAIWCRILTAVHIMCRTRAFETFEVGTAASKIRFR